MLGGLSGVGIPRRRGPGGTLPLLLRGQVLTAQPDVDIHIDQFTGLFRILMVRLTNWQPITTDVELRLRTSADKVTYDAGASDYGYSVQGRAVGATADNVDAADTEIVIGGGSAAGRGWGEQPGENGSATLYLHNFGEAGTFFKCITGHGGFIDPVPEPSSFAMTGYRFSTAEIKAIKLFFESGNIAPGAAWSLWGVEPK